MIGFDNHKLITIKIGSNLLTDSKNKLDLNNLRHLIEQISVYKQNGKDVIIVTSGAIVCGSEALGIKAQSITDKQAAAAVGQVILMENYQQFFARQGLKTAQILLTKDVFEDANRATLTQNTINRLLSLNIIPIVNENDTVSVDEIKFSDNDNLSSLVSIMLGADLHIILTDIDGLYDADPRLNKDAKLIKELSSISDSLIKSLSAESPSQKGRGGMKSKIESAKTLMDNNIDVVIANGRQENILLDLLSGKPYGTFCRKE